MQNVRGESSIKFEFSIRFSNAASVGCFRLVHQWFQALSHRLWFCNSTVCISSTLYIARFSHRFCPRGIPMKHIYGIIMIEECIHTDGSNLITCYLTHNVLDPFYVKNKQINGKYSLPRATAELLTLCIQFEVELR